MVIALPGPSSAKTMCVGPGQYYSSIQSAIDASSDGDTIYVYGDMYPEAVIVDRQITLIGVPNSSGSRPLLTGWSDSTLPGMRIVAGNVTIDGFDLQGINSPGTPWPNRNETGTGIFVEGRSCQIRNSSVTGFATGVRMVCNGGDGTKSGERESVIAGSRLSANVYGVWADGESNLSIAGNDFADNTVHLLIAESDHVAIYQNNFIGGHMPANFVSNGVGVVRNSPFSGPYAFEDRRFTNYSGNYWSDYTGLDSDGDGIGDAPHLIETREWNGFTMNYTDNYPAIGKWSFDNGTATICEPTLNQSKPQVQNLTPSPRPAPGGSVVLLAPIGLLAAIIICVRASSRKRP